MLTIALIAGEDSGDQLGADLIRSLKKRYPDARFVGMGGERMRSEGLECWWDCSELAVFGLFEVLKHFRRIWNIRKTITQRLLDLKPDVFIGIDAPDFNLGLERKLKANGITTVHYVSPTVWAWRAWRTKKIHRAADLVLCLLPFEPDFLAKHDIKAAFVGHPMADQIESLMDTSAARAQLGIDGDGPVFALLPGSRSGEVERLSEPLLGAATELKQKYPAAQFVAAMASARTTAIFQSQQTSQDAPDIKMIEGKVRDVIAAADVVICASGTVTLETMLINRPMVVTYRLSPATYRFAKLTGLVKAEHFSLPNIMAAKALVPELIQEEASAIRIAEEASRWIGDTGLRENLWHEFERIHASLKCDASERATSEIVALLSSPSLTD